MSDSTVQVVTGSVEEHSTQAAKAFVQTVRRRLHAELTRHGDQARTFASYRRLEASIQPQALRRAWPAADVDEALAPEPSDR